MSAPGSGFVAIWSDVLPHQETDYLHWLTREHAQERVGIPGFLGVRIFRVQTSSAHRYFILYRLSDSSVVGSAGYLERLNAPTPWSQRIMPILQNFVRGGGKVTMEKGSGQGAFIVPIVCAAADLDTIKPVLSSLVARDRISAVRLLEVDLGGTRIETKEKSIRTDDRSFAALLLVEALDDAALTDALAAVGGSISDLGKDALHFEQIYSLDQAELATKVI